MSYLAYGLLVISLHLIVQCLADDPHPYGVHVPLTQRAWNAIYNPRLERNFCCCYCTGSASDSSQSSDNLPYDEDDGSMIGGFAESIDPSGSLSIVNGGYKYGNWHVREDLETHCGFEYCRVMFPLACQDHRSTIYSGATGLHDPYRKLEAWKKRQRQLSAQARRGALETRVREHMHASEAEGGAGTTSASSSLNAPLPADHPLTLRLSEVVSRCESVRAEGGAWWNAFQDLGPS